MVCHHMSYGIYGLTRNAHARFSRFAANPEDCAGRQLTSLSVRELVTLEEYSRNMGVITDSGTSPKDDEVSAEAAQNEVRSKAAGSVVVLRAGKQTHEEDSNPAVLGARAEQRSSAVGHWVKDCLARARRVLRENSHTRSLKDCPTLTVSAFFSDDKGRTRHGIGLGRQFGRCSRERGVTSSNWARARGEWGDVKAVGKERVS